MNFPIRRLWERVEIWVVVPLLLYGEALDLGGNCPIPFPPGITDRFNTLMYPIIALLFFNRWKKVTFTATKDWLMLGLVGLTLISFTWSAAPSFSTDESKAVLRSLLLAAYIAATYSPREQMGLVTRVCAIGGILSLVAGLAFPSYGIHLVNDELSWKGIYEHKQYLGRMMTIGAITFWLMSWIYPRQRWLYCFAIIPCITLIILSRSKTSLGLLLVLMCFTPLYSMVRQRYKTKTILLTLAAATTGVVALVAFTNLEWIVIDLLGKDLNFNGRMPIWTRVIELGMQRPWLGYGYAGFWTSDASASVLKATWAGLSKVSGDRFHAHNGFVDLFIQLGFVGLFGFVLHCLLMFGRLLKLLTTTLQVEYFWMFLMVVLMLLFNLTETITILAAHHILWLLYSTIGFSTALQLYRARRDRLAACREDSTAGVPVSKPA